MTGWHSELLGSHFSLEGLHSSSLAPGSAFTTASHSHRSPNKRLVPGPWSIFFEGIICGDSCVAGLWVACCRDVSHVVEYITLSHHGLTTDCICCSSCLFLFHLLQLLHSKSAEWQVVYISQFRNVINVRNKLTWQPVCHSVTQYAHLCNIQHVCCTFSFRRRVVSCRRWPTANHHRHRRPQHSLPPHPPPLSPPLSSLPPPSSPLSYPHPPYHPCPTPLTLPLHTSLPPSLRSSPPTTSQMPVYTCDCRYLCRVCH